MNIDLDILLHPPLVHYPIAFFFLEAVLLCGWRLRQDDAYRRFALFSFKLGYGFMLAAMIAGFIDAGGLQNITGKVDLHFKSALAVFFFYSARAFLWRSGKESSRFYPLLQVGAALLGYSLILVTAYLGGLLVYG